MKCYVDTTDWRKELEETIPCYLRQKYGFSANESPETEKIIAGVLAFIAVNAEYEPYQNLEIKYSTDKKWWQFWL